VAEVIVSIVARRGSPGALAQREAQPRCPPEWLTRRSPGKASQHCVVLQLRPAPEMLSSPPCCTIVTMPPGAPAPVGFGPQASPQLEVVHTSRIDEALHEPLRVGRSSADALATRVKTLHDAIHAQTSTQARRAARRFTRSRP